MSHRFWLALALSLAAVVLLSQVSSAQDQSPARFGSKSIPLTIPSPTPTPGSGGVLGFSDKVAVPSASAQAPSPPDCPTVPAKCCCCGKKCCCKPCCCCSHSGDRQPGSDGD